MEYSGYLDYDSIVPGLEHLCIWTDISFISAFGHIMLAVVRPKARKLHCRDPRVISNYIRRYEAMAIKHDLPQKAQDLLKKA